MTISLISEDFFESLDTMHGLVLSVGNVVQPSLAVQMRRAILRGFMMKEIIIHHQLLQVLLLHRIVIMNLKFMIFLHMRRRMEKENLDNGLRQQTIEDVGVQPQIILVLVNMNRQSFVTK